MKKLCFLHDNKIKTINNMYLNRPSIYFDYKNDTLLKIGEYEKACKIMDDDKYLYALVGEEENLTIIELTNLPVEMACYIICRAQMYSASGFLPKLYEIFKEKPNEIQNWIQSEMNRVPINLNEE